MLKSGITPYQHYLHSSVFPIIWHCFRRNGCQVQNELSMDINVDVKFNSYPHRLIYIKHLKKKSIIVNGIKDNMLKVLVSPSMFFLWNKKIKKKAKFVLCHWWVKQGAKTLLYSFKLGKIFIFSLSIFSLDNIDNGYPKQPIFSVFLRFTPYCIHIWNMKKNVGYTWPDPYIFDSDIKLT